MVVDALRCRGKGNQRRLRLSPRTHPLPPGQRVLLESPSPSDTRCSTTTSSVSCVSSSARSPTRLRSSTSTSATTAPSTTYPLSSPSPFLHPPGKGRRVLPARCRGGATRRRVHRPRGLVAALRRHLAESRVQTVVGSRFLFHSSVEQACERHPEWKSSLRVELLCGYLSNPLCIDQGADLFEECLAGTTVRRFSTRTRR